MKEHLRTTLQPTNSQLVSSGAGIGGTVVVAVGSRRVAEFDSRGRGVNPIVL